MKKNKILIGTRASKLALIYANRAKDEIAKVFSGEIELIKITTEGDQNQKDRLSDIGGKGLFSKKIEEELINKKIDLAVHALKDMPSEETDGLITNCFLERNDPREVLISRKKKKFNELDKNSIVGTSSFRREFQLKKIRKDLNYKLIRGNVDTRLKKLKNGEYDAIVLSKAGLASLKLENEITHEFSNKELMPSAGQGTIAIQCRKYDYEMIEFLKQINHKETSIGVKAEREILKVLDGDCETAVGAISKIQKDKIIIKGELFSLDGTKRYYHEVTCDLKDAFIGGSEVGKRLKEKSKGDYKK